MCSWMLGTEIGLDVLLWTSLGKFPGLVPAPVGCSGALSSFRAIPELSPGWREKFWEKGRGLGPYVSLSPSLDRIKAMKKVLDLPVALNLWWVIIQPTSLLKKHQYRPKTHCFKRWKIKFNLIFQILDQLKDLLLIDILPSKCGVILRGRIWWWQGSLMHNAVAQNNRILM